MSVSRVRQNFQEECEALINKQINMEFYASFVYLSMVSIVTFKSIICHYDLSRPLTSVVTTRHFMASLNILRRPPERRDSTE